MTTFEPHGKFWHMETTMPTETLDTLKTVRDLGWRSVTEAIRSVVAIQMLYDGCQENGSLMVADNGKRLTPLTPAAPKRVSHSRLAGMNVSINADTYRYLQPKANPDDRDDLADFWVTATSAFSSLMERHTLKETIYYIRPGLQISEVKLASPLDDNRLRRSVLDSLRKYLK